MALTETTIIRRYRVDIAWSEEDEDFVARVPAIEGCISHGDTIEEAAANIREALETTIEGLAEEGFPIPEADETLQQIKRFEPFLNKSALARRAGINYDTLVSKLRRGTAFTPDESHRIQTALAV